jgi:hypothetical protein
MHGASGGGYDARMRADWYSAEYICARLALCLHRGVGSSGFEVWILM